MVKDTHSSGATLPTTKFQSAINLPFHLGQVVRLSIPICKIRIVLAPASQRCCEDYISHYLQGTWNTDKYFIISNKAYLFLKILRQYLNSQFSSSLPVVPSHCLLHTFFPAHFLVFGVQGSALGAPFFFLTSKHTPWVKKYICFNYYIYSNDSYMSDTQVPRELEICTSMRQLHFDIPNTSKCQFFPPKTYFCFLAQ